MIGTLVEERAVNTTKNFPQVIVWIYRTHRESCVSVEISVCLLFYHDPLAHSRICVNIKQQGFKQNDKLKPRQLFRHTRR